MATIPMTRTRWRASTGRRDLVVVCSVTRDPARGWTVRSHPTAGGRHRTTRAAWFLANHEPAPWQP
ncbi:MAG: hypothetical protein ACRDNZ_13985 [Streptosporangiaceae bacterium]